MLGRNMLSSIFNSKDWQLVAGSLMVTLIIMGVYHLLIVTDVIKEGLPHTRMAVNQVKLERYAYSRQNPPVVALGSSLLDRVMMPIDGRGAAIVNLCLPGQSAADAMVVMQTMKKTP